MGFHSLVEFPAAMSFLAEEGIQKPTEVQAVVIPKLISGESVDVLAPTGSGKTISYLIPTVYHIKEQEKSRGGVVDRPSVIVLAPTRELVGQIVAQYKKLSHHAKVRVRHIVGGDHDAKIKLCARTDILISAPGKLAQALKKKLIDVTDVKYLIFDEADQLFEKGLQNELITIVQAIPKSVVIGLFSATMLEDMSSRKETLFGSKKFKVLNLHGANKVIPTIETYNMRVTTNEKNEMLALFLRRERRPGVVFVNRKEDAQRVFDFLRREFDKRNITLLHGGMSVEQRRVSYKLFLKEIGVMVCTDIAARGMDIKGLEWVLNYDLPSAAQYYIHRAGRVGRGEGNTGVVYNMVTPRDGEIIKEINQHIRNQTAFKPKEIPAMGNLKTKKDGKKDAGDGDKKKKFKKTPRYVRRRDD